MKRLLILTIALLISVPAFAETYIVERVIDGDTLKLTNGETVKLIGIEIPKDETMGKEATDFLKKFLGKGSKIELEFDVQRKDKYGRILAYVYRLVRIRGIKHIPISGSLDDSGQRYFINATMVYRGYATPMTIPPNVKHANLFKKLYEQALKRQIGLWSEDPLVIEEKHLVCQSDNDCTFVPVGCATCFVEPVNREYRDSYFQKLTLKCATYGGGVCDLAPFEVNCREKKCELTFKRKIRGLLR